MCVFDYESLALLGANEAGAVSYLRGFLLLRAEKNERRVIIRSRRARRCYNNDDETRTAAFGHSA